MRGEIISREYQRIEWVRSEDGKEYACYSNDGHQNEHHTEDRKRICVDLSQDWETAGKDIVSDNPFSIEPWL
jgi:hypothetical protein